MSSFTVLVDSCVLYPAPLRDLIMHLALVDATLRHLLLDPSNFIVRIEGGTLDW